MQNNIKVGDWVRFTPPTEFEIDIGKVIFVKNTRVELHVPALKKYSIRRCSDYVEKLPDAEAMIYALAQ